MRAEQTELMVLITPRLVRPLDPDEVPPLPMRPGAFISPSDEEDQGVPGPTIAIARGCWMRRRRRPASRRRRPERCRRGRLASRVDRIDGRCPSIRDVNATGGSRRAASAARCWSRSRSPWSDCIAFSASSSTTACCGRRAARRRTPPMPGRWRRRPISASPEDDEASARQPPSRRRRPTTSGASAPGHWPTDVTFPACPAGSPGARRRAICVRVDVFRNQERRQPAADDLRRPGRRDEPGRPRDRDGRGAVRQLHRLREAVGDSRQVERSPVAGMGPGRHVRSLRADAASPWARCSPIRTLRSRRPSRQQRLAASTCRTQSTDTAWSCTGTPNRATSAIRTARLVLPGAARLPERTRRGRPRASSRTSPAAVRRRWRPDDVVPLQVGGLQPDWASTSSQSGAGQPGGRRPLGELGRRRQRRPRRHRRRLHGQSAPARSAPGWSPSRFQPEISADQSVAPRPRRHHVTVTRVVGLFVDDVPVNEIVGRLMPYPADPSSTHRARGRRQVLRRQHRSW